MDPTLVPGTRFESQFQICVYEHAILRIYISFFSNNWYQSLFLYFRSYTYIMEHILVLQILYLYYKTYTCVTHAFILNHNKHITITDIIIFMNSYNTFTYIIILVTNLCFFQISRIRY